MRTEDRREGWVFALFYDIWAPTPCLMIVHTCGVCSRTSYLIKGAKWHCCKYVVNRNQMQHLHSAPRGWVGRENAKKGWQADAKNIEEKSLSLLCYIFRTVTIIGGYVSFLWKMWWLRWTDNDMATTCASLFVLQRRDWPRDASVVNANAPDPATTTTLIVIGVFYVKYDEMNEML